MGTLYDDGIDDSQDNNTLRYYADKNQKNIGVALSTWKAGAEEGGLQFNMMVAENEMKMDALRPSRNEYSFGSADALVNIAQSNNMAIRGHCLVWHMQQPTWLSSDGKKNDKNWSRAEALAIMKEHINTVMQYYKGRPSGMLSMNVWMTISLSCEATPTATRCVLQFGHELSVMTISTRHLYMPIVPTLRQCST